MKGLLKILLLLIVLINITIPLVVWWPTAVASSNLPYSTDLYLRLFFPLLGLIALGLLWMQFMVGAWHSALGKLFDPRNVLRWHIWEGVVAYAVALLHPLLLFTSLKLLGLSYFNVLTTLPNPVNYYWAAGILEFLFLTLAVLAGLLRKNAFIVRQWKKVHYVTYLALPLILYHSWNIGSHTQSTMYKYVWGTYLSTYVITAIIRLVHHIKKYQTVKQARQLSNQL